MSAYSSYIQQLEKSFKDYSFQREASSQKYLNNIGLFVNGVSGSVSKLAYNIEARAYDDYIYNKNKIDYQLQQLDQTEYIAFFCTYTLASKYHKFIKSTNQKNKSYKDEYTIKEGYYLLNNFFRTVMKNYQKRGRTLQFCKVIEPHHDYTCHLHFLVYIKKEYKEQFLKVLNNIYKKYNKENDNALGKSFDIEEIRDITRASGYVLKYVKKLTKQGDHVLDGWKRLNKIRMITMSNIDNIINKKMFNVLKYQARDAINNYITKNNIINYNLFDVLNKIIKIDRITTYSNKDRIITKVKKNNSHQNIDIMGYFYYSEKIFITQVCADFFSDSISDLLALKRFKKFYNQDFKQIEKDFMISLVFNKMVVKRKLNRCVFYLNKDNKYIKTYDNKLNKFIKLVPMGCIPTPTLLDCA